MTKIFISYSWDSPEHKDWVFFEIAEKLRGDGLECVSDHDVGFQEQRWTNWMEDQIEEADFVLVFCTEIYLKRYRGKDTDGGRGVTYEGAIISQTLYDAHCRNKKFIAVIPEAGDFDNVPLALKGYNIYQLPQQYDDLFRIIGKQPEYESSPVSPSIKTLPPKKKLNNPAPTFRHNRLPNTKGNFFGRVDELALLNNALTDTDTFIIQFIAAGGTGKTKLLQYWLDQHTELSVLAWSFYSQGASEDKQVSSSPFFEFALEQLNAEKRTFNSDADKGEYLAKLLKNQPCVLVLDGLEPLQHATKGMRGELKHQDIRALLRSLASQTPDPKVLCIITSRLAVQDLDGRSHVKTKNLHNLTTADGVRLLQDLGVTGQQHELAKAVEEYGNHALALSLLGNILVYQYDGLATQREQIAELIEEDGDSSSRHAFKVMQAYAHGFGESAEGRLLNLLGLFDHPINKTVLRWLREQQIADLTAGMNEREFNHAVQSLIQDHHLLSQQENTPEVIDCHPLLREYFGKQLQTHCPSAWQQAHECLYHYYQTLPKQQQPDTLAEMQPLFAAVAHGCAAGLYQQAYVDVYDSRIQRGNEGFLIRKLGAFRDELAVLAQFFSPPWSQPAASLADSDKAVALSNAGFHLYALGRLREALPAMQAGLTMVVDKADWENAAQAASNLSELALLLGELTQAIDYGKQAVRYAADSEDEFQRMGKRPTLADALAQSGEPAQALALFEEAEQIQQQRQPNYRLLYGLAGFRYCQLLLASDELDAVIQRAEQTLVWAEQHHLGLLSIALDKLTLANAYLQRAVRDHKLNDQQTAADFFQQAIAGLEAAGVQEFLTRGLLDRAAFYRQSQQYDKAQQDLNRAFDIADYSGMRLYLCDYHLETARLALAQHDHASATQHHTKAEALIKATGYHRRLAACQELGRCLTKSSKT